MNREATILSLKSIVQQIAASEARRYPARLNFYRDFMSAGWLGAIEAVDRFDPARNVPLTAWARIHVNNRIYDFVRHSDHLSRDHRKKVTRGEMPAIPLISIDATTTVFSRREQHTKDVLAVQPSVNSHEKAVYTRLMVQSFMDSLSPRHRKIFRQYYWEGMKMADIACEQGVLECRISQIIGACLRKARKNLSSK